MLNIKKKLLKGMALISAASILFGIFATNGEEQQNIAPSALAPITKIDNPKIKTNQENYYDDSVIYQLPDSVSDDEEISVIISMSTNSVMETYMEKDTTATVSEFALTKEAKKAVSAVEKERKALLNKLKKSKLEYSLGETYDTLLSGFEITIKAKDFEAVGDLLGSEATLIVGETYEPAVTEVITNDVDVYETGIFDSSMSQYQGDGVVVAVLDTGLDYTHEAFNPENFTSTDKRFTLESVSNVISSMDTRAEEFTAGLAGEDVYVNEKVPYAYDYADKDPDVLPINSEHGTHVAGVIAGKADYYYVDNEIVNEEFRGVAPNAQLAIMKVFSDAAQGAKTSWILAALEDCVKLNVDVINMSLGTSCGFSREEDKKT